MLALFAWSLRSHSHQTTVLSEVHLQSAQGLPLCPSSGECGSVEAAFAASDVLSYLRRPFKVILNELLIINYKFELMRALNS